MFNWVRKVFKTNNLWQSNSVAKNVSLNISTNKKNMVDMSEIPEVILKFHDNIDKFKAMDVKELKWLYKELWWKPNNFINDRYAIIYLISRLLVKHDWE